MGSWAWAHLQHGGVDGVMLGRLARDQPFWFARVDSQIFGDSHDPADEFARPAMALASAASGQTGSGRGGHAQGLARWELEARAGALERYAEYCRAEQVRSTG